MKLWIALAFILLAALVVVLVGSNEFSTMLGLIAAGLYVWETLRLLAWATNKLFPKRHKTAFVSPQ